MSAFLQLKNLMLVCDALHGSHRRVIKIERHTLPRGATIASANLNLITTRPERLDAYQEPETTRRARGMLRFVV
jgi:hypothetical protein